MEDEWTQITQLLGRMSGGDPPALALLQERLQDELRVMAGKAMRNERADHTLQPTALVHEAYLRLFDQRNRWEARAQFLAAAAQAMRRVLVDHARARSTDKRGGHAHPVTLDGNLLAAPEDSLDMLEVNSALERLGTLAPRQRQIVECRVFAGMEVKEIAAALGIHHSTVKRDWRCARAWLRRQLRVQRGEAAD